MVTTDSRQSFRFGDFTLDVAGYELRRKGRPVRLEQQPMDLLILLVERRGQLVSRTEIADHLWDKDVFVDVETGIHTAVRKIRQALHDSVDAPRFIETVPGKGYRFIAEVQAVVAIPAGPPHVIIADQSRAVERGPRVREAQGASSSGRRWVNRRTLGFGLLAVGLLTGVLISVWRPAATTTEPVMLAVLPFDNLTGDVEREYLADGLAEETIASLGQVDPEHLHVVARTSTLGYKRTTKSVAAIGSELRADYLLESSLRAENSRFRITSKLIRVGDQVQVWSESYDREPTSLLRFQQELSAAIAEQIRLQLSPERLDTVARRQTRNPDAYDLYLRGRNFANQRTPATTRRAIEYFERATALDPNYALAWSGIAEALAASALNGDARPLDVGPRARTAAEQAVRARPDLAEARYARAYVSWLLEWDWPAAEAGFRGAVALDPRFAMAHLELGHALSQMGRHGEASMSARRARELDPLYALTHALSSQVTFQARDYGAALEHARQAVVLDPEFWIGHIMRGQAYEQLGEHDLALEAFMIAARFSDQNSKAISFRGYVLAKRGLTNEARDVLKTLEAVSRRRYVPPYAMALVHAGLGERDAVFEWLERAYAARDVHLIFLPVDPKWDPYRADPRFVALVARCGFLSRPATLTRRRPASNGYKKQCNDEL